MCRSHLSTPPSLTEPVSNRSLIDPVEIPISAMDYQSRSLREAAADDDANEYNTAFTPVVQYAPALVFEGDRPNCSASMGDPDRFPSASHLSYARDDQAVDPNMKYSPELEIGETSGAEEPTPTFSGSFPTTPRHHPHQTTSDLGQAANQLRVDPRYQQSPRASPWDAVAPTIYQTNLAPHYFYHDPGHSFPSSTATRSQADADAQRCLSSLAPPTGDGATSSYYSGCTEGSTSCGVCGRTFSEPRQMRRHSSEVHRGEDDPQYVCKCGYGATRKHNYIRHISTSCGKTRDVDLVFICTCREPSNDFDVHLEHVKTCGRKKAGRKPKNARNVRP